MMSDAGQALFLVCALLAVLSAIGTVVMHSPIRAAMSLLAHIVSLTGLFLLLHAHLLAALQLLVYAGAVVVLFVFVIMLIGPAVIEPPVSRGLVVKTAAVALMAVMTAILAFSILPLRLPEAIILACDPSQGAECSQFGGVAAFAHDLFRSALVPFELISVLLTIAVVGAIAVARGRSSEEALALRQRREASAQSSATQQAQATGEPATGDLTAADATVQGSQG